MEVLVQVGFSSIESEFQLNAVHKKNSEKPRAVEIVSRKKAGSIHTANSVKINKGEKIELELIEFTKDKKIFRTKKNIYV